MQKDGADIRRHADEAVMREVAFAPDPFDAEQARMKLLDLPSLSALCWRKTAGGTEARKADAIARATGVWVR